MQELQQIIGYKFNDLSLLQQALTHKSFGPKNNERFEFIGDSLLNCEATILLFDSFPGLSEGNMSRLRANMVRKESLLNIARRLDLAKYIRYVEEAGAFANNGTRGSHVLADAVEALYGAIYVDGGLDAAKVVIRGHLVEVLNKGEAKLEKDSKTRLQEHLQAQRISRPIYSVIGLSESSGLRVIKVACEIPTLKIRTTAQAETKKGAEAKAAKKALHLCAGA